MGSLQQAAWYYQQVALLVCCLLLSLPVLGFLLRHRRKTPQPCSVKAHAKRVNDSLDQPSNQSGIPKMQVLFFHGIPSHNMPNVHLETWCHKDGFLWPQLWLPEKFSGIHVFYVKYNLALDNANIQMHNVGENLVSDLLQANVGQVLGCPVILVGHCIGGLIIKELCWKAHEFQSSMDSNKTRAKKIAAFLQSVKGVFFYSTPHQGIREIARAARVLRSPIFKFFEILSTNTAVLNGNFDSLCKIYSKWKIEGVGESLPVKTGVFKNILVVEDASARWGVEVFSTLSADHFSVCKPQEQNSGGFYHLTNLLDSIAREGTTAQERAQDLQRLPKYFVCMEKILQEMISRLEKVVALGLTGMGGSGKTTLAKAIFNKLGHNYEYSCFIPEAKVIPGSLETLKREVWKYVYRNGRKVGGEENWSTLTEKDIFLVLDDVSNDRDIELLLDIAHVSSARSRFLVTSREKNVFNQLDDISCHVYDVSGLDDDSALQLFLNYAFPNKELPPPRLQRLVIKIVKKCEGLPLTVEVLGQFLKRERKEEVWRQTLDALVEAEHVENLDERLWNKLMPSIRKLGEDVLEMFLDATTFFYDATWSLREAQAAWRAAYGVKEMVLWKSLVDRSLVYDVEEHERIKIHEQLRSLGRRLANEAEKGRVLKTSAAMRRLLLSTNESDEKNMHALRLPSLRSRNDEEKGAVQSLAQEVSLEEDILVNGELNISKLGLEKMERLRFLDVDTVEINHFPSNLVALQFIGLSFRDHAHLKRLVVLKIYGGDEASLANSIGHLPALRILTLDHSQAITTIPDEIENLSKLEVLDICWCRNLDDLPESLGKLSKLKIMMLRYCGVRLPKSLGSLAALEHLELCGDWETLPESFGQLSSLNYLVLSDCDDLELLPDSFRRLAALADLRIRSCGLKSLPDTFGHLPALRRLELDNCAGLESLPESMGNLLSLTHLKIARCPYLQSLPESLGKLAQLEYLEINDLEEVERLPDSLAQLVALRCLIINELWYLKIIPDWIQNLPSLHTLELSVLPSVKELPPWLGETGVGHAFSRKVFCRDDHLLSLTEDKITVKPFDLVNKIHRRAVSLVWDIRNEGVLARLEICSLGIPDLDGFLLTEKGVLKRKIGDLQWALEDLTAAIECYSVVEDGQRHTYDCWKHRGYVKFLMGDLEGAERDGTMALEMQLGYRGHLFNKIPFRFTQGNESVKYMHFKLDTLQDIVDKRARQGSSSHSGIAS